MSVTRAESDAATAAVREEYKACLDPDLAYRLLIKMDDIKSRRKFRDAIRLSLNECNITGERREFYAKVVGKHFGSHGGKMKAARRVAGAPKKAPVIERPITKQEPNGQLAFEI